MKKNKELVNPAIDANTIGGVAFIILTSFYKLWRSNPVDMEKIFIVFEISKDNKNYILNSESKQKIKNIMPDFPINNLFSYQAICYLENLNMISKQWAATFGDNKGFYNFKITGDGIMSIESIKTGSKHKKAFLDKFNVNINFNIDNIFNFSAVNHIV